MSRHRRRTVSKEDIRNPMTEAEARAWVSRLMLHPYTPTSREKFIAKLVGPNWLVSCWSRISEAHNWNLKGYAGRSGALGMLALLDEDMARGGPNVTP